MINIEELSKFCKSKGFVYQSSDIYGGIKGFYDLGPYGVELFNNIKNHWWKYFVNNREDIVGIDASIICNPKVWKASGHLDNFGDLILTCSKTKEKIRADHYIEEKLNINVEGKSIEEINKIIKENNLLSPKGFEFEEIKTFNLLFPTKVGADDEKSNIAYLRGETAQGMFTNFRLIADTTRQSLPFGIAQVGKCFRNEIAPRDFMFRMREFTIAEFEYFINPNEYECSILSEKQKKVKLRLLSAESQEKNENKLIEKTIDEMIKEKRLDEWHAYWLAEQLIWFNDIGLDYNKLKVREHMKDELSHYSSATFDVDYEFPFGSKEIAGNANRGQYDLKQHMKESKEKLELFDEKTKTKIIPRVIEPTFGIDRIFMALITQAYEDDKERGNIVLKLNSKLAPIKISVLPLVNKLNEKAYSIFEELKTCFVCYFDKSGSIGRRYARADELGIPYCVTIDFETLEDESVTIRDRNTTKQERIKIKDLKNKLFNLFY
jgi:glycyl-tRNA synthetase